MQRQAAAALLAEFRGPKSEAALFAALADPSAGVRLHATQALIEHDPDRPPGPLLEALRRHAGKETSDAPPDATEIQQFGLLKLRGVDPVETLSRALPSTPYPYRLFLVTGLGLTGDPRAVDALVAALDDQHPRVQLKAIQALGLLGDPRAERPLRTITRQGPLRRRLTARRALRRLRRRPTGRKPA